MRFALVKKAFNGVINRDELAEYRPYWEDPLSSTYRDYEIRVPKPNSSAFQMLQTLNIMEGYHLRTRHCVDRTSDA